MFQTPLEAFRGLCLQHRETFTQILEKGHWQIVVGEDVELGRALDEDQLSLRLGKASHLHIVPVPEGDKSGLGKILTGIALIGLTLATGGGAAFGAMWGAGGGLGASMGAAGLGGFMGATFLGVHVGTALMMVGGALLLNGVSQVVAPRPELGDYSSREVDQKPSYLFNGAVNTTEEGGPVPLAFGMVYTGSYVVSSTLSIDVEELGAPAAQTPPPPFDGFGEAWYDGYNNMYS